MYSLSKPQRCCLVWFIIQKTLKVSRKQQQRVWPSIHSLVVKAVIYWTKPKQKKQMNVPHFMGLWFSSSFFFFSFSKHWRKWILILTAVRPEVQLSYQRAQLNYNTFSWKDIYGKISILKSESSTAVCALVGFYHSLLGAVLTNILERQWRQLPQTVSSCITAQTKPHGRNSVDVMTSKVMWYDWTWCWKDLFAFLGHCLTSRHRRAPL